MNNNHINIKKLREAMKMSQQEFATELGVAVRTVSRWEAEGKRPSKLALRQLARLQKKVG